MTIKLIPLRESWNGYLGNYSASCENCNHHIDTQTDAFFVIQRAIEQ